ncbi:hypothetical protein [Agromyces laixinhei]|uniref:hypothetical protein n=1 Tax=Agromyces laixinhei TaxID=2585717 RepID=UPI00111658E5|nr:hypothetical protein [Agromyces laixinhei]
MTPEKSRQSVVDVLSSTIAELGTEGWSPFDDLGIEDCTLKDGETGVTFVGDTTGPGADPESTIATVEAHWTSLGMVTRTVEASSPDDTLIRLYGEAGPLEGIVLYADIDQTVIEAESLCAVGDASEIIDTENPDP